MMRKNKKGMIRRGIAIVASVIAVVGSASTIMAYEPFASTDEEYVEVFNEEGYITFLGETDIDIDACDFSESDIIFVYEDGTQVEVTEDNSTYALCIHSLIDGYASTHNVNSTGGCTVKVYHAKKCTKCGYVDLGDLYRTEIYPVCPH